MNKQQRYKESCGQEYPLSLVDEAFNKINRALNLLSESVNQTIIQTKQTNASKEKSNH